MQKQAPTSKMKDLKNYNCFCLTHVWLVFKEDDDNMKHFNHPIYQKT